MGILQLPDSFVNLLKIFYPVFHAPCQIYFASVIQGLLLYPRRKAITKAYILSHITSHWSNLHRFVSQYKWQVSELALTLLSLLVDRLQIDGRLLFALDDTLVAKTGPKIFGRSCHFDHSAKTNKPKYILGHNWVVVGLLYYSPLFMKWICFPFWATLYITKKYLPEGIEFKTKLELAVEMLSAIAQKLRKSILIVTDAAYAKEKLVKWVAAHPWVNMISRLRHDAALYEPAVQPSKRKRGKPRKYGTKITDVTKGQFETATLSLYQNKNPKKIKYRSFTAFWKPAGALVQIVVVLWPGKKTPCLFLCTDLALSAQDILRYVAARWKIEVCFNYLKDHGGLTDWQCRTRTSVTRSATLNCVALSLLSLWSLSEASQSQPELWDPLPWYVQKEYVSYNDMIQQLKAKAIHKTIIASLPPKTIKRINIQALANALKMAA